MPTKAKKTTRAWRDKPLFKKRAVGGSPWSTAGGSITGSLWCWTTTACRTAS
jgi:hypothetical protein